MNKKLKWLLSFALSIAFSFPSPTLAEEGIKESYTILLYMVGSDLEMKNGSASNDLKEMEETMIDQNLDNVKIVGLAGGSYAWKYDAFQEGSCFHFTISNEGMKEVQSINKVNMGETNTLSSFLESGVNENPADHFILLFWNHGNGPIQGFGRDCLFDNDALTLSEMQDALHSANIKEDQFSFVGFDACLMANFDTAKVFKPYTSYMIASQNTESAFGWDYTWLSILKSKVATEEIIKSILQTYETSNHNQLVENYTLSCISLDLLETIDDCVEQFMMDDNFQEMMLRLARNRNHLQSFGVEEENSQLDMDDVFTQMEISPNTIQYMMKECVLMQVHGIQESNVSGLSLYVPVDLKHGMQDLKSYENSKGNMSYLLFINNYLEALSECPFDLKVSAKPILNHGIMKLNIPEETLRSSSMIAISPLFAKDESIYSLGTDEAICVTKNSIGKRMDENWYFLKKEPLYIETDEQGNHKTWIEIQRNDEIYQGIVTFYWDEIKEQANVLDIIEINEEDQTLKNTLVFEEGDKIYPLYPEVRLNQSDTYGWRLLNKEKKGGTHDSTRGNAIYVTDSKELLIQYKSLNDWMQNSLTYQFVLKDFKQNAYYSQT